MRAPLLKREDDRIALAGALVLFACCVATGLAIFASMQGRMEHLLVQELQSELRSRGALLAEAMTEVIGDVTEVTPDLVEELYAADFDHLQRLYERINTDGEAVGAVTCPHCSQPFEVDLTDIEDGRLGE